ncbi:MAG: 3-phosphoshikimate 1-carboxyvinyltransferase, partial [Actinomycetota bacterium]|nr:3-phosphoshikimate 1-carboxyvinyltransferase [Actinomycetota bacterium]
MTELEIAGAARPLTGRLRVPGDKSISHRAILLAALAEGRSTLRGLSTGGDVGHTRAAMTSCGAGVACDAGGTVTIDGGRDRLHEPDSVIDVGNSGTGIRLLAGWCAGQPWLTILQGDASIATRPMGRVADPLRAMGARIDGRRGGTLPPLVVRGGGLHGIDYPLPVASAQVKSAILLAGLAAVGATTVREQIATRAHTEELLALCQADIAVEPGSVTVRPSILAPLDLDVAGDPSQAAFWVVAACIVPGSDLVVEDVYVGPGRAGFLAVLERMGADVVLERPDGRRLTADLHARYRPLSATAVGGAEIPSMIDEIPALAVAAACADGVTTFSDAAELRVKESDRVTTLVAALVALGVDSVGRPDGLAVVGNAGRPLG